VGPRVSEENGGARQSIPFQPFCPPPTRERDEDDGDQGLSLSSYLRGGSLCYRRPSWPARNQSGKPPSRCDQPLRHRIRAVFLQDGDDEPDARSADGGVRGAGAGGVVQVGPPPPRGRRRWGPRRLALRQALLNRWPLLQGQLRRRSLLPVMAKAALDPLRPLFQEMEML